MASDMVGQDFFSCQNASGQLKSSNLTPSLGEQPEQSVVEDDDDDEVDDEVTRNAISEEPEIFVEMDESMRFGRYDEILGSGACKIVYRGFDEVKGIEVAWNKEKFGSRNLEAEDGVARLEDEVKILKTLGHKNVIKIKASWIDKKTDVVNFITEIFNSGTLRQYSQKHKHIDLRVLKNWARQILSGLVYLHGFKPTIIHRDLKCENIFINGTNGEVKIADLGVATFLSDRTSAHTCVGTPEYMAPELYEQNYDEKVDIYSFGMCILELITRSLPYSECGTRAQIFKKVMSGEKPNALLQMPAGPCRDFIEACTSHDAALRPSAATLLKHAFLAKEEKAQRIPRASKSQSEIATLADNVANKESNPETFPAPKPTVEVKGQLVNEETLKLQVRICTSTGKVKTVEFNFAHTDTPEEIAREMVEELSLPESDRTVVQFEMEHAVDRWREIGWGQISSKGDHKLVEIDTKLPEEMCFSSAKLLRSHSQCLRRPSLEERFGLSPSNSRRALIPQDSCDTQSESRYQSSCVAPNGMNSASVSCTTEGGKTALLASCSIPDLKSADAIAPEVLPEKSPLLKTSSCVKFPASLSEASASASEFDLPDQMRRENSLPLTQPMSGLCKVDQWLQNTVTVAATNDYWVAARALLAQVPNSETRVRISSEFRKSSISSVPTNSVNSCPEIGNARQLCRKSDSPRPRMSHDVHFEMSMFPHDPSSMLDDLHDMDAEEKLLEEKQQKEQEELRRRHEQEKEMIRHKKMMRECSKSRNSSMKSSENESQVRISEEVKAPCRSPLSSVSVESQDIKCITSQVPVDPAQACMCTLEENTEAMSNEGESEAILDSCLDQSFQPASGALEDIDTFIVPRSRSASQLLVEEKDDLPPFNQNGSLTNDLAISSVVDIHQIQGPMMPPGLKLNSVPVEDLMSPTLFDTNKRRLTDPNIDRILSESVTAQLEVPTNGSVVKRQDCVPVRRHSQSSVTLISRSKEQDKTSEKLQTHVEKELRALEGFGSKGSLPQSPHGPSTTQYISRPSVRKPPVYTNQEQPRAKSSEDGLAASAPMKRSLESKAQQQVACTPPVVKTPEELASEKGEKLRRAEEQRKVLEMKALSELNNKAGCLAAVPPIGGSLKGANNFLNATKRESAPLGTSMASCMNSSSLLHSNGQRASSSVDLSFSYVQTAHKPLL